MTISAFTAIDFETANHRRGSPCAVGAVRVEEGRVVSSDRLLMRPTTRMMSAYGCRKLGRYFDPWNVQFHGIGPDHVADSPEFPEQLQRLQEIIGTDPVVAHNASFDVGVVRDACDDEGSEWPEWSYFCTLTTSRRMFPDLESYSLPHVLDAACSRRMDRHHDPVADARAAADIAVDYLDDGSAGLDEVLDRVGYRWGRTWADRRWNGCTVKRTSGGPRHRLVAPDINEDADTEFTGRTICLTGSLPYGVTRQIAWNAIADMGGEPVRSVTKKVDLVVVSEVLPHLLAPGAERSRKHDLAVQRGVEIMSGKDFLDTLVDGGWHLAVPAQP